jgi:hypothetical protein
MSAEIFYEISVSPRYFEYPELTAELRRTVAHGMLDTGLKENLWPIDPPRLQAEKWLSILPCMAHKNAPEIEIGDLCACSRVEVPKGSTMATTVLMFWSANADGIPA